MKDIRQNPEYAKYLKNTGWLIEKNNDTYYFIKKIPFIGSIIKLQRPEEINIKTINRLMRKYRAFQILIEPINSLQSKHLQSLRYKLMKKPYLPSKTLQLDLTQSQEDLFLQLKKDNKHALSKSKNLKSKIYESKNIEDFRNSWKKSVGLKRYIPPLSNLKSLIEHFDKNSLFITDNKSEAGAVFLLADKIGYYWQAFTNKEGRKSQAQYKLVWQGILWAKRRGAKIFDFEGIYDKRFPDKSWLGFTHFKKSFGGYEIEYPGCYTKFRLPI